MDNNTTETIQTNTNNNLSDKFFKKLHKGLIA